MQVRLLPHAEVAGTSSDTNKCCSSYPPRAKRSRLCPPAKPPACFPPPAAPCWPLRCRRRRCCLLTLQALHPLHCAHLPLAAPAAPHRCCRHSWPARLQAAPPPAAPPRPPLRHPLHLLLLLLALWTPAPRAPLSPLLAPLAQPGAPPLLRSAAWRCRNQSASGGPRRPAAGSRASGLDAPA